MRADDAVRIAQVSARAAERAAPDAAAKSNSTAHAQPRAKGFVAAADVIREPAPEEIVEGIAWSGCVSTLVGEPATGKTFVLLSLAAAVAHGLTWCGRDTKRGAVAYVSFEGDALGLRLQALAEHGHDLDGIHILRASSPISPRVLRDEGIEAPSIGEALIVEQLEALAARLAHEERPPVALMVVDTLRASLSGSEDNSEAVAAYLRATRRILATRPGAGAIVSHHAGWQDGEVKRKRERGSSALRGNIDATLYLETVEENDDRSEVALQLVALKVRDAERPPPLRLIRRRVDVLALNRRGEPMSSCIVVEDTSNRHQVEREKAAEQQAQAEAADRQLGQQVLTTILAHPDQATSKDRIRDYVGGAKPRVSAAVTRLLQAGFIEPGRRGQPYRVTETGKAAAGGVR
jgi:RecA-family ATPase